MAYIPRCLNEAHWVRLPVHLLHYNTLLLFYMVVAFPTWSCSSWQRKPVAQEIEYANEEHLGDVCEQLQKLPELVSEQEVERLNSLLEQAANGKAFVIQGGDCAEAFNDINPEIVALKQSLLVNQATFLGKELYCPIVTIGRIAGQYSKPRSRCQEQLLCGRTVNAFRGDNINSQATIKRSPNPERLLLGYFYAAATTTMLRMGHSPSDEIGRTFFTSHEALHLSLEESLTRGNLNASAHMLWIGERSRGIDGAHVEYIRGLQNPIGVKLGPNADPEEVVELLSLLDPEERPGRVTLITRFGAKSVAFVLPLIIRAVQRTGHRPVWLCDPMHGNTFTTAMGIKTRSMQTMLEEIIACHLSHLSQGSRLCGLHLEQTGEEVTECVEFEAHDERFPNYRSLCDPRLSGSQAVNLLQRYVAAVKGI